MAKLYQSEVKITISLDENKVPEKMHWTAQDGGVDLEPAKAMLLSLWNPESQEAARLDLWVKDMPVDQMQVFFHQTLVGMTDSFIKATNDEKMGATMQDFCDYFAEKLEIKK